MPTMPASRTIPRLLDELATRFPDREALVGGASATPTRRCAMRCAPSPRACTRSASRKGDKVAILMGNKPEWIIADLAICLLGGVMVAVNTWVTSRELQHILAHSDATVLIATRPLSEIRLLRDARGARAARAVDAAAARIVHVGARPYRDSIASTDVFARGRDVADAAIDRGRSRGRPAATSPTSSTPPARPRRRRACSCSTTR